MHEIDKKDTQLLRILQTDAKISNSALAKQVNLSDTPCLRRIKKLQSSGVIVGYHAVLNREAIGLNVLVYAFIKLNENSANAADKFENHVGLLDAVISCSVISGSYDYLLEIVAKDLADYEYFVKHQLASLNTIAAIESTIVLKQTFSKRILPI